MLKAIGFSGSFMNMKSLCLLMFVCECAGECVCVWECVCVHESLFFEGFSRRVIV